ncbi:MAG: hypothetical protein KKC84_03185, partial [Candidatus Omnitrophica bacterium]|nr:hypothetical protein [Candidatus Omnitrophota bacterium]
MYEYAPTAFERFFSRLCFLLLCFLIFFSPLIFGGITPLPLFVIESVSFFLFFFLFLTRGLKRSFSSKKLPLGYLFLFLGLVLFQILPLPQRILAFLSPSTHALYAHLYTNLRGVGSLSIYPEATIFSLLQWLAYLAIFLSVIRLADSPVKIQRIAFVLVASGFLYAFYGILGSLHSLGVAFSTFTNRNHFSS